MTISIAGMRKPKVTDTGMRFKARGEMARLAGVRDEVFEVSRCVRK
jgi:hypothetical protein